jgi:hypothetical protein
LRVNKESKIMKGKRVLLTTILLSLIALSVPRPAEGAPVAFSAAGPDQASIQATVDAFRAALGSPNNGNAPGPLAGGRREINWDGGGSTATAIARTPFTGFLTTRGALFTTPGTGFVQAPVSGLVTTFDNPTYSSIFQTFSPVRLLSPIGSNITDALFITPGVGSPGIALPVTINGFGVVFTDVDLATSASIELFDARGRSLGIFFAPPANNGLSFIGVVFNAGERVARVRITSGNGAPGATANDDNVSSDVVVMDDFIYGEPMAILGLAGGFTCLQDDTTGSTLVINKITGEFQYSDCDGVSFGGTGRVRAKGCLITLDASLPAGRVTARIDTCADKGTADVHIFSKGRTFTTADIDTTNNSCACP